MRLNLSDPAWRGCAAVVAGALALATPQDARAQRPRLQGGPWTVPAEFASELQAASGECCISLLFPIGARRASMGEAVTSVGSADAVFFNPAGLAEVDGGHFVVHHVGNNTQQIDAFTLLLSPGGLATFGLSYELIDYGDSESTDAGGVLIGRSTIREHVLIASFATSVLAGISAGLNYKYFTFRIDCSGDCGPIGDVNAATHGLDLGMQYRPAAFPYLRAGVALLNVGFPLQVVNIRQSDPMPTRLRAGVSYDLMHLLDPAGPYRLWLLLDAEDNDWREPTTPNTSIGLELSAGDIVFLRAGYAGGEGVSSGPAVGVGIIYASFNLAVAKRVSSSGFGDDPFQVTLDVGF